MLELTTRGTVAVLQMTHGKANAMDIEFCRAHGLRGTLAHGFQVLCFSAIGAGSVKCAAALGLVNAPDQEQAPDLEIPRMRGVHPVAMLFERRPCCVERPGRPGRRS